jgi:glycerol-3-phosphate O-acyltransferase
MRDPRMAFDRAEFLKECLGYGRQLLLQGEVHSADAVSQELYGAAVKLAANRDLVDPGREALQEARRAYLAEVEEVVDRLSWIGAREAMMLEEVLHDDGR